MTTNQTKPIMPPPPPWAVREPEDQYHAKSKSGEAMSSGKLKKFRDCAFAYRQEILGKTASKDSNAFRFGRAVHKMILEGREAFDRDFAIGGPINENTGKCYGPDTKTFADWLAANGYTREQVINDTEADTLVRMADTVHCHSGASAYLDFGWPELVVRADLHGVPCQIRIDWLTHDADGNFVIVDLKTVDEITWFQTEAYRYEYPHQFAFYRDVLQAAAGVPCQVAAIAVEKKEPFRVGVWNIPVEVLDLHSAKNREALEDFKQCQVEDVWPTGYEEARVFPMPRIGA